MAASSCELLRCFGTLNTVEYVKIAAGSPSREDLEEKARFLQRELEADGCRASGDGWLFARYNKDSWPRGPFRRNDLLIPLEVHRRLPPAMLHVHI